MTYIKKLVMYGFKSFARKTEVPFEESMNVIVGPNGSGKSNITDALCFVLGRMSFKSMRVAKAANLLFSGNKTYKGANEAIVELILDNKSKEFSIDKEEISIKRIVRKDGVSTYKINDETKTRQELLELLAEGGIDPNGFNIVLQGDIASMIKMSSEDRRKIIEDVAGISIYETRKDKSINELNKTNERLNEVSAVLKERNSYLRNLEKERQEALNFQKLDLIIKRSEKSLLNSSINEKEKSIWSMEKIIEGLNKEIQAIRKKMQEKTISIEDFKTKINIIQKKIQDATSGEQSRLTNDVSDLKANIVGYSVRKENFEKRYNDNKKRIENIDIKKDKLESEINEIQTNSPDIKKKREEQKKVQEKLNELEQLRRKYYLLKSQVSTIENQTKEKEKYLIESEKEMKIIEDSIESLYKEIRYSKSIDSAENLKIDCKKKVYDIEVEIKETESNILLKEKENAVLENLIKQEEKLKDSISNLKKCPTCKQSVQEDYKKSIQNESKQKVIELINKQNKNTELSRELIDKKNEMVSELNTIRKKINNLEIDILNLKNIDEKNKQIKNIVVKRHEIKEELEDLNKKFFGVNKEYNSLSNIENQYEEMRSKLNELNFSDIDVDSEVNIKQREIVRLDAEKRNIVIDTENTHEELKKLNVYIVEKQKELGKKESEMQKLYDKCEKMYEEKASLSDITMAYETEIIGFNHTIDGYNEKIGNAKIKKAELLGHIDSLKSEIEKYKEYDIYNLPIEEVKEKLSSSRFKISHIGNVNMRALEVFDKVNEQVKLITEKVETLNNEREKILEIIEEIDKKKKKVFIETLNSVNEIFVRNCSSLLSNKGEISLELDDKKDPFNGGLNILIRTSKSKYFDVASLSGGEKTMVSLSLIFAIQEFKPYCFYILDEIDSALDKNNSEILAELIKKYMKSGQYIIVTHNDALISESSTLYGVSMQENISKITSLKLD